jgi:hypothetical protein
MTAYSSVFKVESDKRILDAENLNLNGVDKDRDHEARMASTDISARFKEV